MKVGWHQVTIQRDLRNELKTLVRKHGFWVMIEPCSVSRLLLRPAWLWSSLTHSLIVIKSDTIEVSNDKHKLSCIKEH